MGELALKNGKLIEERKIVVQLDIRLFKIKVGCLKSWRLLTTIINSYNEVEAALLA